MVILFWVCVVFIAYIYAGYPLLACWKARKEKPRLQDEQRQPSVSILVAAHNEVEVIESTILNKIDLDYPADLIEILVVSDASDDGTDERVAALAERLESVGSPVRLRLFRQSPRQGKTAGLNLLATRAEGEILVFTDANSLFNREALRTLLRNFADPAVGYVTGKMVYVNEDGSLIGDGCSAYMRYENRLRFWETRSGSVVGGHGGIDAMRRSLYRPLQPDQLPDFVQPLGVVERGFRVVFEPEAMVHESTLHHTDHEWPMRKRVALRALWGIADMRHLLNPFRYGYFSIQLVSHKLLRYLAFIPLLTILPVTLSLQGEGLVYRIAGLCEALFLLLALLGYRRQEQRGVPALYSLPYYFVLLNAASLVAFVAFLTGQRKATWQPRKG